MKIEEIKAAIAQTKWTSIATEIRPSSAGNGDGGIKPFYLTRTFTYYTDDTFELIVVNYADPFAKTPLAEMYIKGHIVWKGDHPIAPGAQKVDFIADITYTVKPLSQAFADILNKFTYGFSNWEINAAQDILGKTFAPFGLAEGQLFSECDLIYLYGGMMFWGARNVDGRGFDTEENRPTNLQIPLVRKG